MPDHKFKTDFADSLATLKRTSHVKPPNRPPMADRVARMWIWMTAGTLLPPLTLLGAYEGHGLRDETRGLMAGQHVEGALTVFWRWLIAWGVGLFFAMTLVGIPLALLIWMGAQAYLFFNSLKGLRRALDGKPLED